MTNIDGPTDSDRPTEVPLCENELTTQVIEDALGKVWGVANDLSKIRPPRDRYRVSVFGSSRKKPGEPIYDEVKDLGRKLSRMGCDVITGGGPGLMQAANEGAHEGDPHGNTESLGIRVDLPFEAAGNPYVETMYRHRTFFSRLHQFVRLSNAFVVVPGGIGTALETMMVWQLLQVRHVTDVPLVMVGEMWQHLVDWSREHMTENERGLASPEDMNIPRCVETVDEAIEIIREHHSAFRANK